MKPIEIQNGKRVLTTPVVFSCGCGSVAPDARRLLALAKVNVPLVMTTSNDNARFYINENDLRNKIPALAKSKHSVLYNPFTKQYVNLLGAPKTDTVIANVGRVARGGV